MAVHQPTGRMLRTEHSAIRLSTTLLLGFAALVAACFVTAASYPGFMSYDSMQELLEARTFVDGSQYPPFGSYVWRLLDWIAPGPTLMQFVQNGLLLFSVAYLLNRTRLHVGFLLACLLAFVAAPPILGTMLVVWKDVAVAACYMAALALAVSISRTHGRERNLVVAALSVFFVWCGMAYRFNAISGALSLIFYTVWKLRDARGTGPRVVVSFAIALVCTAILCAAVWVLNNYRLPGFERLARNTNPDAIIAYDLIGISAFSNQPIVPSAKGGFVSPGYLKSIYDPRHLNITAANDHEHLVARSVDHMWSRWLSAIASNPLAYLKHRASVFREYISLHQHEVFYVTQGGIAPNRLGITYTPTALSRRVVAYVWDARFSVFCRPWMYYVVALAFVAALGVRRKAPYKLEAVVALSSGYLYFALMFFITPAADLRYNLWSVSSAIIAIVFSIAGLVQGRRSEWREEAFDSTMQASK